MKLRIKYKDFVNTYPKMYKSAIFYPSFLMLKPFLSQNLVIRF